MTEPVFNPDDLFQCFIPSGVKGWIWLNWQYLKRNIASVMVSVPEKKWRKDSVNLVCWNCWGKYVAVKKAIGDH